MHKSVFYLWVKSILNFEFDSKKTILKENHECFYLFLARNFQISFHLMT